MSNQHKERSVVDRDVRVNGWAQQSILPPEHLRIEVTAFLDVGDFYCRVGIHVSDYVADVVLGIYTTKTPVGFGGDGLIQAIDDLVASAIREHYHPF